MKDWPPAASKGAGRERRLATGESLFRLGDRTAGCYKIVKGRVRLLRVGANGQEVTLYVASAGDFVAEASLFSATYHCDAVAMTDAVVQLYPKAAVLAEFRRNPEAARAFMAMLAHQIMTLRTRLEQRNIRSARDRVRHFLNTNVAADGRTVAFPGTLKELASELGLTHEALYRALAQMATDGEIERRKNAIRLKTPRM
jgi:CRP-like cAMP-binding protein